MVAEFLDVKKIIPPIGVKIIVLTNHYVIYPDNIYTGVMRKDEFYFSQIGTGDYNKIPSDWVTHWMHIPQAPKN